MVTTSQASSPCSECRYDYAVLDHSQIIAELTSLASKHSQVLASVPRLQLSERSRPATWSPLEYGCHVRDVLRFQHDRVVAAQAQDRPVFASMRRDERAVEERYNEQDPLLIADSVVTAAALLAAELTALDEQGWQRVGIYPWPAPAPRTVEWVARWTDHELAHHLFDIHRLLGSPGDSLW
jgi:S-DNA-T family DNA segregation ATPase FtsK/SpoIIIE